VANRIIDPPWYSQEGLIPPDDPRNILGSRWLGFDLPGYGIHGTTDPASIGKPVTQGCVRLANADVEELFILLPEGTPVTIVE
jgi:lipoprotein-anchoring transpeptidase ErfK/SrfK